MLTVCSNRETSSSTNKKLFHEEGNTGQGRSSKRCVRPPWGSIVSTVINCVNCNLIIPMAQVRKHELECGGGSSQQPSNQTERYSMCLTCIYYILSSICNVNNTRLLTLLLKKHYVYSRSFNSCYIYFFPLGKGYQNISVTKRTKMLVI